MGPRPASWVLDPPQHALQRVSVGRACLVIMSKFLNPLHYLVIMSVIRFMA